jgi:prepilin-type N-terminal cleavage/methylation domain-containing protein
VARDGREAGYTLLEMLLVLLITAVLVNIGSGLASLVERQRNYTAVLDLRRSINYARGMAVNLQEEVTLCALDSTNRCHRHWRGRDFATFTDRNHNRRLDQGEALQMGYWPEERGILVWRAALGRKHLVFKPFGDTNQNGSFLLCRTEKKRTADVVVVVNRGGRSYVGEPGERPC